MRASSVIIDSFLAFEFFSFFFFFFRRSNSFILSELFTFQTPNRRSLAGGRLTIGRRLVILTFDDDLTDCPSPLRRSIIRMGKTVAVAGRSCSSESGAPVILEDDSRDEVRCGWLRAMLVSEDEVNNWLSPAELESVVRYRFGRLMRNSRSLRLMLMSVEASMSIELVRCLPRLVTWTWLRDSRIS